MTSGARIVPVVLLGLGLVSGAAAQNVLETAGLRLEVDGRGAIGKLIDPGAAGITPRRAAPDISSGSSAAAASSSRRDCWRVKMSGPSPSRAGSSSGSGSRGRRTTSASSWSKPCAPRGSRPCCGGRSGRRSGRRSARSSGSCGTAAMPSGSRP